ncbi:MAG TPA: heme exporter protein CcmD [Dongiaceae bacterium]|jgi:heme exporter protein D|nr:heme exporter protein CcmD [Dongiaceae bacterium]
MSEYFAMGGYAAFIWPSYALALVLLVGVFALAARRLEAATRALDDRGGDGRSDDRGDGGSEDDPAS